MCSQSYDQRYSLLALRASAYLLGSADSSALVGENYGDRSTPWQPAAAERARPFDLLPALSTLSGEHRDVLLLREAEGLSYDAIGRILNLGPAQVVTRLTEARRELLHALRQVQSPPSQSFTPFG